MSIIRKTCKKIVFSLKSSYVLMFHHVTDSPEIKRSNCLLQTSKFYDIIDSLSDFNRLEDVLNNIHKNNIAITFDDGLADLYTIAYPYLIKKNIPFTAFIVTDFLDKPGYITTKQLIEMSKNPLVTIGSHGVSHRIFTNLNSYEKEIELKESKRILEELIKKRINLFAYSHGIYDKETLKFAGKNYMYGMSVNSYPLNFITKKRMENPRFNIDNNTYMNMINILKYSKSWRN